MARDLAGKLPRELGRKMSGALGTILGAPLASVLGTIRSHCSADRRIAPETFRKRDPVALDGIGLAER